MDLTFTIHFTLTTRIGFKFFRYSETEGDEGVGVHIPFIVISGSVDYCKEEE